MSIRVPAALLMLSIIFAAAATSTHVREREALLREVEAQIAETSQYTGISRLDDAVLSALRRVPRHEFVPVELRRFAYDNTPLPIGEGQTISQPYIVALMTALVGAGPGSKVLEIGTGSGYQAAVLAEIADHVYTIEIVPTLGRRAERTLDQLGYTNVTVRIGDGYRGWPEEAPFDAIIVTAAPERIPQPLIDQLARGGRLVAPVGPQDSGQSLQILERNEDGTIEVADVLPVRFVPFTRD